MYTMSQIRRRVDALKRKYASELTIIRLRPLAEEYCLLWTEALSEGSEPPDSHAFIRHIARQGFRLSNFTSLHIYLERCREGGRSPNTIGIVASLLPEVRPAPLEELLLSDADADREPPVSLARWTPSWVWNPRAVAQLLGDLGNRHAGESRYPEALPDNNQCNAQAALSATSPPRIAGSIALAMACRFWGKTVAPAQVGTSTSKRNLLASEAAGGASQRFPCHLNPAGAKLPTIPHTRSAIRHPLRC